MAQFGSYQNEIYGLGLRGVLPTVPVDYATLVKRATAAMPDHVLNYVQGGCGDEFTQDQNALAFHHWGMVPRMMVETGTRDLSADLFGHTYHSPLFMAPIGVTAMCSQDQHGDIAAAQASAMTGVPMVVSTLGNDTMEDVAPHLGDTPGFFQLYTPRNKELAESLIARDGSEIETLEDLAGKRVAVPVGSTAHFSLMGALDHAGIEASDLTLLNMPPDQIAAAWEQGAIDAAFIWQPVQNQILETGTRLATSAETAEWGFPTFDAWVVSAEFAAENAEAVAAFAKTMDEANAAYLADPAAWTADSAPVQSIAAETGADAQQVPTILEGFTFVPLSEQLGETWLGSAHETMRDTAEFLNEAGRIDQVAEDYSGFVNTEIGSAATQ